MRARRGSTSFSKRGGTRRIRCARRRIRDTFGRTRARALAPCDQQGRIRRRSGPHRKHGVSRRSVAEHRLGVETRPREPAQRRRRRGAGTRRRRRGCRQWSPPHRNSGRRWRCVTCSSTFLPGASFCAPPVPRSGMRKTWCGASPSPGRTCRSRFITTTAGCSTCRADWNPCADSPVCWGKRSRRLRWRPHSRRTACPCTDS